MEGKKRYIAIVLFLLIGLTLFAFANPTEEEKGSNKGTGNGKETSEVSDKKTDSDTDSDGTLEADDETNTQNQAQVLNQQIGQQTDNSYANALAAIKKAEQALVDNLENIDSKTVQDLLEDARDLINDVTSNTSKAELNERADIVEEALDAIALVEALEELVNNAENKEAIIEAIDYRTDNQVNEVVENLRNETVKDLLEDILEEINLILDDKTAPSYDGIKNNETTKEDVTLTVTDDTDVAVTVTLNGEKIEYTAGEAFTEEGVYKVVLVDEAFNETTITFTIDKTAPVVTLKGKNKVLEPGHYTYDLYAYIEDASEYEALLNGEAYVSGTKISKRTNYTLVVTDAAGNETTVEFAIDKDKPKVSGVENEGSYNTAVTPKITDKNLSEVTLNGEKFVSGTEITEEGEYTLIAKDQAGNTTTVTFTIDKTAAKKHAVNANVLGYKNEVNEQYATNGNKISAYISINEELKYAPTFTFYTNGNKIVEIAKEDVVLSKSTNANYPYVYTATLVIDENLVAEDGVVTFEVTDIVDKAGNKTEDITKMTTKKVITLDRTAAERVYSTVRVNKTEYNENGTKYYYVKNGDSFEFAISFNELLAEVPTVTIGGKEVEMKLNEKVLNNENKFLYEGTFKIAKDEAKLAEGALEIKVSNVKDLAGNESTQETVVNQTKTSNGRTVIYDCKNPVVTGVNNNYHYNTPITIKAVDYIVHNVSPIATATIDGEPYELGTEYGKEGTHLFVAYDRAGNRLGVNFTIDYTAPTYAIYKSKVRPVESVSINEVDGKLYVKEDVEVQFHDNFRLLTVALNDGEPYTTTEGVTGQVKYLTEDGEYKYTVTDKAGNSTTVTIVLDKTPATINLAGTAGKNKNEYHVESGTKVTLEDVMATVTDNFDETVQLKPYKADLLISNIASENTYKYDFTNGFDTAYVGRYNIYYEYTDAAGNTSTACMLLVMKDTTAPTVKVDVRKDKGITDIVASDVTKLSFEIYKEGKKVHSFNSGLTYKRFSIDWLGDGVYTVVAIDEGGNKTSVEATIDHTAPVANYVEIKGITTIPGYAKVGDEVWVGLITNEEMATLPTIKINGVVAEKVQEEKNSAGHKYYAKVIMTQEMAEGEIQFTIEGYKDAFDNEGVALSNKDINLGLDKIIFDKTAPTLTVKENSVGTDPYYSEISFSLSDNNTIDYFEVNGTKMDRTDAKWSDANYQNIKDALVAGENTIVLYDTAGNKTSKTFYMDWTVPTIEVKSWVGNNPYSGASFKLSDNYLIDYFVLNGKKYDRTNAKWSDANYDNIKSSLVDGENTLVLYDAAGNSTTYTFTLERVAPTITVSEGSVGTGPYSKLNLKMYDASGIASVVINGTQLPHTGYYVDINDGHAYTFLEGTNTVVVTDNAGNVTTQTFVVDNVPTATTTLTRIRVNETDSRYVDVGSGFLNAYMNMVYTYTFKFNEPVKITNANYLNNSYGPGFGENQNVSATKIDGLTSNADADGYATEITIEYNFNKLNLVKEDRTEYIKGDSAKITFADKAGNEITINEVNGSSITLSILR